MEELLHRFLNWTVGGIAVLGSKYRYCPKWLFVGFKGGVERPERSPRALRITEIESERFRDTTYNLKVGCLHPVACTRSGSGFPSNATLV
jgi:hypothetical protein